MSDGSDFGLIGLAVMGQNLVLNVESRGFTVSVYNRTTSVTDEFIAQASGQEARRREDARGLRAEPRRGRARFRSWSRPAAPVDAVIEQLIPLLEKDDIIIDGGNSLYTDTERRDAYLAGKGLRFIGAGVSRRRGRRAQGPVASCPAARLSTWEVMKPIFESIAAKVDGEPCVIHIGPGGAGHYVKMIHNGIEYGDMQLICEAYNIFKHAGFTHRRDGRRSSTSGTTATCRATSSRSPARRLSRRTRRPAQPLVELILDKAGQKGTGQWTLINAAENAVVISTINAAVEARILSSHEDSSASPPARNCTGRERRDHRRPPTRPTLVAESPRRALRLQDHQLRAGARPDQDDGRKEKLGARPRPHRRHLARRLHHPRAVPQPHHRGLPRRSGLAT